MYTACYFRLSKEEQETDFETQAKLVLKEADEANRVKTIIYFNDGTSRELSDYEIQMIFAAVANGAKYVVIEKSRKTYDYTDYLIRRRLNDLQHNTIRSCGGQKI